MRPVPTKGKEVDVVIPAAIRISNLEFSAAQFGSLDTPSAKQLANTIEESVSMETDGICTADPPENCHLTVKKLQKNLTFFSKKLTKIDIFFNKIAIDNFLTVKWQFSGGSGHKKV